MTNYTTDLAPAAAADTELAQVQAYEQAVADAADKAANQHVFEDYRSRKADNTLSAQQTDLQTFCDYLAMTGVERDAVDLATNPHAWTFVSHGHVKAFLEWMKGQGYSIASINRKLSTVKRYCKLAAEAEAIAVETDAMVRMVAGYSVKEGKRLDERRETTRVGHKKADHTPLTVDDANQLKFNPSTPQGRRDTVLMCLLLDHGLRVGEVVALQVTDIDMAAKQLRFYRPKVDRTQTHKMSRHTFEALQEYFDAGDAPAMGALLRGSRKGGTLTHAGMNRQAVSARVRTLGEEIGVEKLSAHDCRHYWASRAATMGTDAFALRDAGGWSSLAMPSRYVEAATVANERVRL